MNQDDLSFFKNWFSDYCKSFYSATREDNKNISLKVEHTYNVCKNVRQILVRSLESGEIQLIAEAIALFHDIGRFPQYARYRTFRDNISVNHGLLGAKTLLKEKILQNLPENEQELIIQVVKFHNAFTIPHIEEDTAFFLKLIRDADKLDVWRVFIEYYESDPEDRTSVVGLGLPDIPEYSKGVLSRLHKKQMVPLSNAKTLNDFKLIQLSWVYDLNFMASFKLLLERGYMGRIISRLPQTEEIHKALTPLQEYVHQKMGRESVEKKEK